MVLTGLPADGKASFWIAPHCGFRYRKRRFYRILMLLARYDGHMNPVFEKPENHIPCQNITPVLEKAAFPMRNRSQRTKEGIKAAFQAEIRTPVSEKTGKTNPNRSYS